MTFNFKHRSKKLWFLDSSIKFDQPYNTLLVTQAKSLVTVKAQEAQEEEAEEELVDPQVVLREECRQTPKCLALAEKLQQCNDRVNSKSQTTETCVEELFDLLHAVDACVTPKLFPKLK